MATVLQHPGMDGNQLRSTLYRLLIFIALLMSVALSGSWIMAMRTFKALGGQSDEAPVGQSDDRPQAGHAGPEQSHSNPEGAVYERADAPSARPESPMVALPPEVEGIAPQEEVPSQQEIGDQNEYLSSARIPDAALLEEGGGAVEPRNMPAPPAPQDAPQPERQEKVVPPRPLANGAPQPFYPLEAYRYKKEGSVRLGVLVDAKGVPKRVRIAKSSKIPELDRAAAQAVYDWRFKPATVGGKPTTGQTTVTIDFKLN